MEIHKIIPQGYCGGVKHALNLVYKCLEEKKLPTPIYMLGSIIHNQFVVDDLVEKGIILLEDKQKTRLELLKTIPNGGTVIFSAHGVSPEVIELAKEKNLYILDTTCKNVQTIHENIKKYLDMGYTCAYIGTPHHPECEGVLGISKKIKLIQSIDNVKKLDGNNLYVTNQTTLSYDETKEIYDEILGSYPNAIIDNKICNATTLRQQAMKAQIPTDLCIVVGDQSSSNTKKLAEVSKNEGIPTILISDKRELENYDFHNLNTITISSGASTPEYLVDDIISEIKKLH